MPDKPNSDLIRPTLLLINSEPQIRSGIRLHLAKNGWNVHPAGNVKRAIQSMVGKHIDAILLDTHIDGVSGLVVGTLLRRLPQLGQVIFGMTSNRLSQMEELIMQRLNPDFVLRHPIDPKDVEDALNLAVKRRAGGGDTQIRTPSPQAMRESADSLQALFKDIELGEELLKHEDAQGLAQLGQTRAGPQRQVIKGRSPGLSGGQDAASRIREREAESDIAKQLAELSRQQSKLNEEALSDPSMMPMSQPPRRVAERKNLSKEEMRNIFKKSGRRESEMRQKARIGVQSQESNSLREIPRVDESASEKLARAREQIRLKEMQAELRKLARRTGKADDDIDLSSIDAQLRELQTHLEMLEQPGGLRKLEEQRASSADAAAGVGYKNRLEAAAEEIRLKALEKELRKSGQKEAAEAELLDSDLDFLRSQLGDLGNVDLSDLGAPAPTKSSSAGSHGIDMDALAGLEGPSAEWFSQFNNQLKGLEKKAQEQQPGERRESADQFEALRRQLMRVAQLEQSGADEASLKQARDMLAAQLAEAAARARFGELESKLRSAADTAEEQLVAPKGPSDIQLARLQAALLKMASEATAPMEAYELHDSDVDDATQRLTRRAGFEDEQRFKNLANQLRKMSRETERIQPGDVSGPTDLQLLKLYEQLAKLADDSGQAARGVKLSFEPEEEGYWESRLADAAEMIRKKRAAREERREANRRERDERINQQLALRNKQREIRTVERDSRQSRSGHHFRDQNSFIEEASDNYKLPDSASELIEKVEQFQTEARDVADALDKDAELVNRLLAFLNSSMYEREQPFESLEQAVEEMGAEPIRDLVIGAEVFDILATEGADGSPLDHRVLWLHSVGVAMLCMRLARLAGSETSPETLFTSGLLHDFGKVMMDELVHEDYARVVKRAHRERIDIFDAENNLFETNHSKIARGMMSKWHLPRRMYQAVACHHLKLMSFDSDAIIDRQGAAIVVIANRWMHARGWGDGVKDRQPPIEAGWFAHAGVDAESARVVFDSFEEDMRASLAFLDITGFLAAWQKPEYTTRGKNIAIARSAKIAICTIEEGLNLFADQGPHSVSFENLDDDLALSQADTLLFYAMGIEISAVENALDSIAAAGHVKRLIVVADSFQEELSNPGVDEFAWRIEAAGFEDLLEWQIPGSQVSVLAGGDEMDVDADDVDLEGVSFE